MRQLTDHRAPWDSFSAADPAPRILITDPALQHRPGGLETLPSDSQAKLLDQAEAIKIRGSESRLRHVEVFLIGSVVTPIIERPRPLSTHRHAHTCYTLIREEPLNPPHRTAAQSSAANKLTADVLDSLLPHGCDDRQLLPD